MGGSGDREGRPYMQWQAGIAEVGNEPCVAPQALCAAVGGYVSFYASNLSKNHPSVETHHRVCGIAR